MMKIAIANWLVAATSKDNTVVLNITNQDGTPIYDTESDIGAENELGYRLTSGKIEKDYTENGDAKAQTVSQKLLVDALQVDIVNDEDNHLNLFISHVDGGDFEHASQTNGTESSPSCDIVITL